MKKQTEPYLELLKIVKEIPEENESIKSVLNKMERDKEKKLLLDTFIEKFNFDNLKIDKVELLIVAKLFYKYADGNPNIFDALALLSEITKNHFEQIELIETMKKLIKKGIILLEEDEFGSLRSKKNRYQSINTRTIIDMSISLSAYFIDWLFSEETDIINTIDKPYESNDEFINDWFKYLQNYKAVFVDSHEDYIMEDIPLDNDDAKKILEADRIKDKIEKKLSLNKIKIPFQSVIERYKLNKIEQMIVMYLIRENVLYSNDDDGEDILRLTSTSKQDFYKNRKYLDIDSKLLKKKILYQSESGMFRLNGSYLISKDILEEVLALKQSSEKDKLTDILKGNEIFTLLEPNQTFEDLILADEVKSILKTGLSYYNKGVNRTITNWGLFDKGTQEIGKEDKVNDMGLLMLFYGSPGTGKTFAAGALANSLGKKLLITDVSKIKSMWHGESEKNVKKMFEIFEEIVNTSSNPPIILMNEADQFLHKRMSDINRSMDQLYNAIQNLFLEAFEKLKGILIATTNMHENLDPAFGRRFHLKIEFPVPEYEQRRQLWNLHITNTIPSANDVNIDELAYNYKLSGGQIKVIVRNACIEAASREKTERILNQDDIIKYCDLEHDSEMYQKEKQIGF